MFTNGPSRATGPSDGAHPAVATVSHDGARAAPVSVPGEDEVLVRREGEVCFLQIHRVAAGNTISPTLVERCRVVLAECESDTTVVVLEGLPHVFCAGADFQRIHDGVEAQSSTQDDPESLYRLWLHLARGPFVSVAHVRGKATAGGVGFVAACDVAIASDSAQFGLSELLFGLFPACVMPFLVRRVGLQNAHYLTLMTRPIDAQEAHRLQLVDAVDRESEKVLRQHLRRLRCLSRASIVQYKNYMAKLGDPLEESMPHAVQANRAMFSDPQTLSTIHRYVETGRLPWER